MANNKRLTEGEKNCLDFFFCLMSGLPNMNFEQKLLHYYEKQQGKTFKKIENLSRKKLFFCKTCFTTIK